MVIKKNKGGISHIIGSQEACFHLQQIYTNSCIYVWLCQAQGPVGQTQLWFI